VAKHNAAPSAGAKGKSRGGAAAPSAPAATGGSPARALSSVDGAAQGVPADFDRLIHERMRLGIVSALAVNEALAFNDLKRLMRTTDGNLSVHARKLEEAGYVQCTKSFEGRMPKTEYRITPTGRQALGRYLDHMEALIRATRER
jgi:DNA-binding HxlR family transcriptional regulator